MITFRGRVAVYFNRHTTDGLVWCVGLHAGDQKIAELAVREVVIDGARLVTRYEPQVTLAGERRHDGPPSAWQEGEAHVELTDDGRVILRPARSVVSG